MSQSQAWSIATPGEPREEPKHRKKRSKELSAVAAWLRVRRKRFGSVREGEKLASGSISRLQPIF